MKALKLFANARRNCTHKVLLQIALTVLVSAATLSGCGQQAAETSADETATPAASTGFVSDAAIRATQQAAQSLEQSANAESARIAEETGNKDR